MPWWITLFCSNSNTEKDRILCKTYLSERLYQCQADCPVLKPSILILMFQFGPFWHHSNILCCFLNPLPSQNLWVSSCKTSREKQVNQLSYKGMEQAVLPTSSCIHGAAEKNTKNCAEASLPAGEHFHRHRCYPLTVWLHLKWATCNFPPSSREQGCQCCSDSGGPSRIALSCWASPGESLLSNWYRDNIAE